MGILFSESPFCLQISFGKSAGFFSFMGPVSVLRKLRISFLGLEDETMQVTKITGAQEQPTGTSFWYTDEQLKAEYRYLRAEQITKKLLAKGLISEGEFNKIMAENRRIFRPFMAEILV